jgi:hypothetical protein
MTAELIAGIEVAPSELKSSRRPATAAATADRPGVDVRPPCYTCATTRDRGDHGGDHCEGEGDRATA